MGADGAGRLAIDLAVAARDAAGRAYLKLPRHSLIIWPGLPRNILGPDALVADAAATDVYCTDHCRPG